MCLAGLRPREEVSFAGKSTRVKGRGWVHLLRRAVGSPGEGVPTTWAQGLGGSLRGLFLQVGKALEGTEWKNAMI